MKQHYQYWGKIRRTRGIHGALVVETVLPHMPPPPGKHLWIQHQHTYIPYRITNIHIEKEEPQATIQLKQVQNPEKAKKILHHDIYLPPHDTLTQHLQAHGHHLIGYQVLNKAQEVIGKIIEIQPRPMQPLLLIQSHQGQEHLIPYHLPLLEIDEAMQQVVIAQHLIS